MFVKITCIGIAVMAVQTLILSSIMLSLDVRLQGSLLAIIFKTNITFPFSSPMNSFYVYLQTRFCRKCSSAMCTSEFYPLMMNSKMVLEVYL